MDSEHEIDLTNLVDLTGIWLINFGLGTSFEGSRIITLSGCFNKDEILDILCTKIYESIGGSAKKVIDDNGKVFCIRNMTRIG